MLHYFCKKKKPGGEAEKVAAAVIGESAAECISLRCRRRARRPLPSFISQTEEVSSSAKLSFRVLNKQNLDAFNYLLL
jgi:hypothetical protein